MNVLLHVTDDSAFEAAVSHLAAAVRPGGRLVLLEPAVRHGWHGAAWQPTATSRIRTLTEWQRVLASNGLHLMTVTATTNLLASVVDTRGRFEHRAFALYWNTLTKIVGRNETRGRIAARALESVDRVLLRSGLAVSGKCLVAALNES